ncbi:MAG: hypothetical protein RL141_161 [Candidatus Parcubacteria bacterium]
MIGARKHLLEKRRRISIETTHFAIHYLHTQPMNGVIKKVTEKGFGFITPEGGEKDVFFHMNSLVDVDFNSLREGDAVTFDVEESPKGPNAVNVKLAPAA